MDLPIDYRRLPVRQKYLDEETPMLKRWFVFGTHDDGTVDISDGTDDILTHLPPYVAERVVTIRRQFVDALLREINGPKA